MELRIMNDVIPVNLEHDIKHGPSSENIGSTKVITRARFDEETQNKLQYYFKDSPPIEITTHVGMMGDQEIEIKVPSFEGHPEGEADININWQGLEGILEVAAGTGNVKGKIRAPLLTVSENSNVVARIERMEMNLDVKQKAAGLWIGRSGINISEIDIQTPKEGMGAENVKVHVKGISIDQISTEKDNLLSQSMVSKTDSLTVMDRVFTKGIFDSEVRNLNMDAFSSLNRRINDISEKELSQDEASREMIGAMAEILPDILSHSPEYVINRLSVKSDQGDINGNASIKYIGEGDYRAFNPLNELDSEAMISVPKTLVREIALIFTRKQMASYFKSSGNDADGEEFEKFCQLAVDSNIQGLLQKNLIVEEGNHYTSRFALKGGSMTINDQPLHIPVSH
jgi:uncharacterized protein YdgA (DUF945 family)